MIGKPSQPLGQIAAPWPSSASSVLGLIDATPPNEPIDLDLRDPGKPEELRFVAGGFDALMSAGDGSERAVTSRRLIAALGALTRRPSPDRFAHFYDLVKDANAIEIADELVEHLNSDGKLDRNAVGEVARRVAGEAPDIAPVKLAMVMLGVVGGATDVGLLSRLSRYEELTLYGVVALANVSGDDAGRNIWAVAKSVDGWGKIQAVRRLTGRTDPEIRDWLLREGGRNSIMIEELAALCAREGQLLAALNKPLLEDAMLRGAGELLRGMIPSGSGFEDFDDYPDAANSVRLFVRRVCAKPARDLLQCEVMRDLADFVNDAEDSWSTGARATWTAELRWEIRTKVAAYVARPEWRELIQSALEHAQYREFHSARELAATHGIDPWPVMFERQRKRDEEYWYFLMQTDDPERIEQVVALAQSQLNLALVGSGPGRGLGLGPDYVDDSAMDFIVQDLIRFPGQGWPLIDVSLRGRSIRLRYMALKALTAWGRDAWPDEAYGALQAALLVEPEDDVRAMIKRVLAGEAAT